MKRRFSGMGLRAGVGCRSAEWGRDNPSSAPAGGGWELMSVAAGLLSLLLVAGGCTTCHEEEPPHHGAAMITLPTVPNVPPRLNHKKGSPERVLPAIECGAFLTSAGWLARYPALAEDGTQWGACFAVYLADELRRLDQAARTTQTSADLTAPGKICNGELLALRPVGSEAATNLYAITLLYEMKSRTGDQTRLLDKQEVSATNECQTVVQPSDLHRLLKSAATKVAEHIASPSPAPSTGTR